MSLKDLALQNQYRSDRHDLLDDFYIPCLKHAETCDRAVGFFSSTEDYIGRQYVLVYNSPKPDVEPDAILLGEQQYPLLRSSSNEFEYTEIIEVEGA